MIIIGIDPGATNVGVSVRDGNDVLHSSTYVRPEDMPPTAWAVTVAQRVHEEVVMNYPDALIGIEGVTVPNAYNMGKKNLMSPKYIIWTALVVGALASQYPYAVIVRPGKNGSQDLSMYPEVLKGRRPKDLAGVSEAGTRNHEKSAYDIAGEVEGYLQNGYKLDDREI
jgi:hypothetical protein